MSDSSNCFRDWATVAVAAAVLACWPSSTRAQGLVIGGMINVRGQTKVITPNGGSRISNAGDFSLHAAATVAGAAAPNPKTVHLPVAQPAGAPAIPIIIARVKDPVSGKEVDGAFPDLPNGNKTYMSQAKNFPAAGMVNTSTSTPAASTFTTPAAKNFPNPLVTTATAEAKINFSTVNPAPNQTVYNVDSMGSVAKITGLGQNAVPAGAAPPRAGPASTAATLTLDPLTFSNVQPRDTLSSTFSLSKSDFQAQVGAPGLFAAFAQAGTDLLGPSPGNLGPDFAGNQTIFTLQVSLTNDSGPTVIFQHNPNFNFYNPDLDPNQTGPPIPDSLVDSTIDARLLVDLDPTVTPGGMYLLQNDINLFSFSVQAPQNVSSTVNFDLAGGQIAELSVPEPPSLVLAALGGLGVSLFTLVRRSRRRARPRAGQQASSSVPDPCRSRLPWMRRTCRMALALALVALGAVRAQAEGIVVGAELGDGIQFKAAGPGTWTGFADSQRTTRVIDSESVS